MFLAFSMTLASCSNVETLNGAAQVAAEVQAAESQTPYATVEELDAITNGTAEYVYWRVARTFALMELESFRAENGWDGAKLTKLPVLVYDSMSRPKYYEYRVVLEGREIGAITCVAQKRDGGPTAYVLPSPSDYSQVKTKGAECRIVANGYPKVAYTAVGRSGIRLMEGEDASGETNDIEASVMDLALMHPEYFTNSNITIEIVTTYISNTIKTNLAAWKASESIESNLLLASTNDEALEEIAEMMQKKGQSYDGGTVISGFDGTPGKWWDWKYVHSDKCLNWGNSTYYKTKPWWCGPTAVAMILVYYGYTDKIRYKSATEDGFYNLNTNMNVSKDLASGNLWGPDLEKGIAWATDRKILYRSYNTFMDYITGAFFCSSWDQASRSIDNNFPFIMNRFGWLWSDANKLTEKNSKKSFLGFASGHYRVGLGYKDKSLWVTITKTVLHSATIVLDFVFWKVSYILWIPVIEFLCTFFEDKYYLLTDGNGHEEDFYNNPVGRDYIMKRDSSKCKNIFWEKKGTADYLVAEFLFRWY